MVLHTNKFKTAKTRMNFLILIYKLMLYFYIKLLTFNGVNTLKHLIIFLIYKKYRRLTGIRWQE